MRNGSKTFLRAASRGFQQLLLKTKSFLYPKLLEYKSLRWYFYSMPFDKESARLAGQKSRRGRAKKLDPTIREKMELLYEEVLDHLIMHQDELSNSDRVRLVQSLSNYLLPKTKSVRDEYTLERIKEMNSELWNKDPDPRE